MTYTRTSKPHERARSDYPQITNAPFVKSTARGVIGLAEIGTMKIAPVALVFVQLLVRAKYPALQLAHDWCRARCSAPSAARMRS